MSTGSSFDNAAQTEFATRLLALDLARLAATDGDDTHADVFHSWLHGLPLPVEGSAARPLRSLGVSLTANGSRVRFDATGATSAMIEPAATFFAAVGATEPALADVGRFGAAIDPDAFATWIELDGASMNAGWEMSGHMDSDAAWSAIDDRVVRRALSRFGRLATIGRSVGGGVVTTRVRVEVGAASDDDAVAAATQLLADVDAPMIDDRTLGSMLAEAGERPLSVTLWALDDGLARAGLSVADAPLSLVVRLAADGGWVDAMERMAAVQGAIDAEHPSRVECFVDASGAGTELGYVLSSAERVRRLGDDRGDVAG